MKQKTLERASENKFVEEKAWKGMKSYGNESGVRANKIQPVDRTAEEGDCWPGAVFG
ncbi:MAG: hypothetical protein GX115_02810, partial [Ruminiclostridium sp.]|nr:hypothetical protein [Ruminiclostridium sp.]